MSPEQGTGGEVDGRSDQYSLACVVYEMLVGQPPFTGPNAMALLGPACHGTGAQPARRAPGHSRSNSRTPPFAHWRRPQRIASAACANSRTSWENSRRRWRSNVSRVVAVPRREPRCHRPLKPRRPVHRFPERRPFAHHSRCRSTAARPSLRPGVAADCRRDGCRTGTRAPAGGRSGRSAPPRRRPPLPERKPIHGAWPSFTSRTRVADHSLGPLTDGLTEELIRSLTTVQDLEVISSNGVAPFRAGGLPRDSVARALKVGTLVIGEVEPTGDGRINVTARLVDAGGSEIKRVSVEEPLTDALAVRDSLPGRVADLLRERLGEEVRLLEARSSTRSTDAWVTLQRAEQQRKRAELAASTGDSATANARFIEADSLALAAAAKDPVWGAPLVFRGRVAYRRSRLSVGNPLAAEPMIAAGLVLADSALQRDASDPDALELRGNLRYWRWLLRLEPDDRAADALLASAQQDLEASVKLAPMQAGAWGSLSHLYYQSGNLTDVLFAARHAYDADSYLENAGTILDRLFSAAYDLDQPVDASRWCNEGARRFPKDAQFMLCQLYLMTMKGQTPDVAKAWVLASSPVLRNDQATGSPEFEVRHARMVIAAILARAGLRDSASAVIASARAGADIDPTKDLYHDEAFAHLQAGDHVAALAALKVYLSANPDVRDGLAEDPGWWFRELATEPGFKAAVGTRP